MTEHSRLFPPSGAYRWVNCTASAEAVTHYADVPSEAGQEGTAWHWLMEQCLTQGIEPAMFLGRTIVVRDGAVERKFVVSREMATDAQLAVDFVRQVVQTPGESRVEAQINLAHIHPTLFGRTDMWHNGDDGILTVCDGKYGRVSVPVLYPDGALNWQMTVYTLGILSELASRLPLHQMPRQVRLVIIQPRDIQPGPRVKYHTVPVEKIYALEPVVIAAVHRVLNAPQFVMGDWCKYCPALGACPPSQDELTALAPALLGNADMGPADAARIMKRKDLLEKIVKEAERVAAENLLRGVAVPGFKLVTGTKHRKWDDEDAVFDLAGEIKGAYKVVTPAQMEKLPGGKDVVAAHAMTPPGEPTVAPESDKRAPYVAKSANQMFGTN